MNNEFNPLQNELAMSGEEQRSHKKIFSGLSLSVLFYILISEALAFVATYAIKAIDPSILENGNYAILVSSFIQYLVAFPLLYLIVKRIPAQSPKKSKLNFKEFFKLLTVAVFVMYVGNYLSNMVLMWIENQFGAMPENSLDTILSESSLLLSFAFAGIIGPIVEEIIFRKLIIDRLTKYGDVISILFPSLIFGLIHGNLYQFFYAFFIGVILSYIYVKTGSIIYSSIVHCFINLFFGIFPSYIFTLINVDEMLELAYSGALTDEYVIANQGAFSLLSIYAIGTLLLTVIGVFNFNRGVYRMDLQKGLIRFPKGTRAEIIFFNIGTIILITVCIIIMAINTFSFAVAQ